MAIKGTRNPTLRDLYNGLKEDGSFDRDIVELVLEANSELLADAVVKEANGRENDRTTIRTGLPDATWTAYYEGTQPSKGAKKQVSNSIGTLKSLIQVDKELIDDSPNGAEEMQRAKLERTGLWLDEMVMCATVELGAPKPQPESYRAALAKLGVSADRAVMIGDSLANDVEGARRAFAGSALPLIADESCITERDVADCADRYHGVNIKLTKCGGLAPARRMIAEARSLGLKVMCGCMTESTVGISAGAQLLPLVDYADLDGAVLLADDTAAGVTVTPRRVVYPDTPGTGAGPLRAGLP